MLAPVPISVPSSSGNLLRQASQSPQNRRSRSDFSPLLIGESSATARAVGDNAGQRDDYFSPLLIGESSATLRATITKAIEQGISVPSSSGNLLRPAPRSKGEIEGTGDFSPLLIGESSDNVRTKAGRNLSLLISVP